MQNGVQFSNLKRFFAVISAFLLCIALSGCTFVMESAAPALGSAKLTSPTIKENGTLKVGVNTSQSPFAGMGNSKIIGIDVDIAAAMADSLGLKLQIVDTGSNPAKALSNGDVDIALGVVKSDASSGIKLTDEYLPAAVAYFKKPNAAVTSLDGDATPKIAAQASSKSAWTVTNSYGNEALESASDLATAFQSLSSGSVEYVAADAVIGMYAANKAGVSVEIAGIADAASGYCAAMLDSNTALVSDISTVLTNLVQDGTVATIEKKWLGDQVDLTGVPQIKRTAKKADTSNSEATQSTTSSSGTTGTTATDANSVIASR